MGAWVEVMLTGNGHRVAERAPVVLDEPALTLADIIGPRPEWHRDAACREHQELSWYREGGSPPAAVIAVCHGCLVRRECLTAGLHENHGVRGALSVAGRRRLLASASAA